MTQTTDTTLGEDDYALRRVLDLRGQMETVFDTPATQSVLKDARANHLAEAVALNEAAKNTGTQSQAPAQLES